MHEQNSKTYIFTNNFPSFTEMKEKPIYADLSLIQVFHRIWLKLLQGRYSYHPFLFL
jgi:hypothetical protein